MMTQTSNPLYELPLLSRARTPSPSAARSGKGRAGTGGSGQRIAICAVLGLVAYLLMRSAVGNAGIERSAHSAATAAPPGAAGGAAADGRAKALPSDHGDGHEAALASAHTAAQDALPSAHANGHDAAPGATLAEQLADAQFEPDLATDAPATDEGGDAAAAAAAAAAAFGATDGLQLPGDGAAAEAAAAEAAVSAAAAQAGAAGEGLSMDSLASLVAADAVLAETEAETGADTETDAETQAEAETEAETDAEAQADAEAEAEAEAEADTEAETEAEAAADPAEAEQVEEEGEAEAEGEEAGNKEAGQEEAAAAAGEKKAPKPQEETPEEGVVRMKSAYDSMAAGFKEKGLDMAEVQSNAELFIIDPPATDATGAAAPAAAQQPRTRSYGAVLGLPYAGVRLLVIPISETPFAATGMKIADEVAGLLPKSTVVFRNPLDGFHVTLLHTSYHTDPRPDTRTAEAGAAVQAVAPKDRPQASAEVLKWEAEAVTRLVASTTPPTLVLDRIAMASSGSLLALWTTPDGAVQAFRRAAFEAVPGAATKVASIVHTTLLRVLGGGQLPRETIDAISAACERWTEQLRGTQVTPEAFWYVIETEFSTIRGERTRLKLAAPPASAEAGGAAEAAGPDASAAAGASDAPAAAAGGAPAAGATAAVAVPPADATAAEAVPAAEAIPAAGGTAAVAVPAAEAVPAADATAAVAVPAAEAIPAAGGTAAVAVPAAEATAAVAGPAAEAVPAAGSTAAEAVPAAEATAAATVPAAEAVPAAGGTAAEGTAAEAAAAQQPAADATAAASEAGAAKQEEQAAGDAAAPQEARAGRRALSLAPPSAAHAA